MDPRVKHYRLPRMHTVFFRSSACQTMAHFHGPLALSARDRPRISVRPTRRPSWQWAPTKRPTPRPSWQWATDKRPTPRPSWQWAADHLEVQLHLHQVERQGPPGGVRQGPRCPPPRQPPRTYLNLCL